MAKLFLQRCLNNVGREAVARCPSCGQFFCRECITEHHGRVICAACLKKLTRTPFLKRRGFVRFLQAAHCVLGFLAAWFIFYVAGEVLLRLPASFHEGTLWTTDSK